jgi:hypothetical protein
MIAFYLLTNQKTSPKLYLIIALFTSVSLYFGFRYSTPFYFQNNDQISQQLYLDRTRTTTSSRLEILPKWGSSETRYIGAEDIRIAHGSADLEGVVLLPEKITFTAAAGDEGTIYRIRRNYFPSWHVKDETGKSYPTRSTEDGLIDFRGSAGLHTYSVYVGSTRFELLANWISLLTLLYILARGLRPKLKDYLDSHCKDWDISIALRYLPIVDALKKNAKTGDKILEVGSEITGITPYFKHKITGLDQGFDYTKQNTYLKPVEGSATAIPFKDRSFDYVISVDCIEHIPPRLRAKAIEEMLRVAGKRVYLTFPVGEKSESIDKMLDQYFYARSGKHFNYLVEHVENGLPDFDFVRDILSKHPDWTYQAVGNTSTWLWVILLKMGLSNVQWAASLYRRLLFLIPLLKHCNFGHCYRQLYTLTRIGL